MYETNHLYKLLSWNLKGYRETIDGIKTNKLNEQTIIDKFERFDFVFLEETHIDNENKNDISIPGFTTIHYCRKKRGKAHKASGGITVLVKEKLRKHITFLPESDCDTTWIKISFNNVEVTFIGCVYIPPGNSSFGKDHSSSIWDKLEAQLQNFSSQGNVILCGDFNARTGVLCDYISNDGDNNQYTLPNGYVSDTFHPRRSADIITTKSGRKLSNICIDNDLYILNGRTIGDLYGACTCVTPNGTSVVDYFICSKSLYSYVHSMHVHDLSPYSDHRPVEICIYLPFLEPSKRASPSAPLSTAACKDNTSRPASQDSYSWTSESAQQFRAALNVTQVQASIASLQRKMGETDTATDEAINAYTQTLTDIIHSAAEISLMKRVRKAPPRKQRRINNKKWFDRDCYIQRKKVRSLLNALNRNPFNKSVREQYFSQRKKYNSHLKKKKLTYKNAIVQSLNNAVDNDPNSIWDLVKNLKTQNHQTIQANLRLAIING